MAALTLAYRGLSRDGQLSDEELRSFHAVAKALMWPVEVKRLPFRIEVWADPDWLAEHFYDRVQAVLNATRGYTWTHGYRVRAVLLSVLHNGV